MKKTDILIIGGGPAGISAAIWCQRLGLNYLLIEEQSELGGQLKDIYNRIVDYPGYVYENGQTLKQHLTKHIDELDACYHVKMQIHRLDHANRIASLIQNEKESKINYRYLILATGTSVRRLDIPGEQEMIDRGEIYSATKDRHRFDGKKVVVVGGGDRAFEGALLLAESGAKVYLVHRSKEFRAREEFKRPVTDHSKITILCDTVVKNIQHAENGIVGVDLRNRMSNSITQLSVEGVFIRIGVQPNIRYVKEYVNLDEGNYVQVDSCQRTSDPYIYAIGDVCTHPVFSSISNATAQGMIAAKHLSLKLS
ncbi:NAD(P)/FAD-dependent oxidoreductase [Bacillus sp. Marseille-Q3570]|uniref:NAD(P)/FAD-dependent oxidoreductase n=1 Tax=Bacillus sp. Marseille-Q3570 TaxID=2963522 RepID=UPI0021B71603|nr:NAD(P)/FAD-dependent oxidoreductase [Bacillus sp. Marseille-Q3570]